MKNERKPIKISFSNVKHLANQNVDLRNDTIIRILNLLNLTVFNKTDSSCSVLVPFSRNLDLLREVDLIEEIIRISGFTDLNARLPISVQKGKVPKIVQLKQNFRKAFINFGLDEVMHFTLSSKQEITQPILKNPILNEKTALRSTLISSLIEKSSLNQRQTSFTLQAFEFGRIYQQSLNNNTRITEKEIVSGIFSEAGYAQDWSNSHKDLHWFEGKGFIEDCFSQIGLKPTWVNVKLSNKPSLEWFHQTKTAELDLNGQIIGYFGQINPVIAKQYNLSKNLFIFEFDLDAISAHWTIKNSFRYENYSVYPSLSVDLSLIIPAQITFNKLKVVFKEISQPILKTITLLDYYEGKNIPDGHYSLTVKLEFQTFEKTLTTEEIDNKIVTICDNLKTQYNVLMRS
jgi:phenylalanyl-tRNA synthetase beta chain